MSNDENINYWEIRLEQALGYLSICGFEVVDVETHSDIVLEDARGNLYHHTATEIIKFQEEGIIPGGITMD